jgi:hypothetical protein
VCVCLCFVVVKLKILSFCKKTFFFFFFFGNVPCVVEIYQESESALPRSAVFARGARGLVDMCAKVVADLVAVHANVRVAAGKRRRVDGGSRVHVTAGLAVAIVVVVRHQLENGKCALIERIWRARARCGTVGGGNVKGVGDRN